MKIRSTYRILNSILLLLIICNIHVVADNVVAAVKSPNEDIELKLLLDDHSSLYYMVNKSSESIVSRSNLGINTSIGNFVSGLSFESVLSETVNEEYTLPSGKKSVYFNNYNEIKTTFSNSDKQIQVIVRAYNDGIAYRYELNGSGNVDIYSEASECNITSKDQIYSQVYSRDYKNIIEESDWERESCLRQTSLPLIVKTNDNYVLISEAMVNGNYSASRLIANDETQAFTYSFTGTINSTLPFRSPWRTMMTGSLNTIVESVMMENLNPETEITDISWIKPGRAVWNYGGEDTSDYLTIGNIRKYIDWAEEMGWEYFTLDRGWQDNSNFTLEQVISYAQSKNTGVFVWVNQNSLPSDESGIRNILQNWKNKGVKGLKVDFWENDSQTMMKKYDFLLRLASEQKLMLNFHSCTKPTGLRRTWPHLLTSEAIRGNAYYTKNPDVITAGHNINSAIIRNSLGATDYNPVDFADKNGRILYGTTWAHQLALSVVFESGIQHLMDAPDNIRYNISNGFLKTLPVAWDDTKCIEADLENYVTIARRKGDDWYVASLTNESGVFETTLSFLSPDKTYNAYIYKDGDCPSEILFEYKENLISNDKITMLLASNGGFALRLSPSDAYEKPLHVKYEAESADNIILFGVSVKTDKDSLCSNRQYVASIGKGRALTFRKITVPQSGTYAVTFYYTAEANRTAYIKVNGKEESWKEYSFAGTGIETGSGLGHKTVFVELDASIENIIEYGNYNDFAPNLDRIVISKSEDIGTSVEFHSLNDEYGKVYAVDKKIIIEQEFFTRYQIYNSVGQLMQNGSFNGGTFSVPITDTGVYLVRISSNNHNSSKKIMIK